MSDAAPLVPPRVSPLVRSSEFVTTFNTNPIVSFNLIASGEYYIPVADTERERHAHMPIRPIRVKDVRAAGGRRVLLSLAARQVAGGAHSHVRETRNTDATCAHVAGLWFYGYNELATMTIKKTSAVTQSVANTAKRVIVIVGVAIVSAAPSPIAGRRGTRWRGIRLADATQQLQHARNNGHVVVILV